MKLKCNFDFKLDKTFTFKLDRNEPIELWINNSYRSSSSQSGPTSHGFVYKDIIFDYKCATDQQVLDYLNFYFPANPQAASTVIGPRTPFTLFS